MAAGLGFKTFTTGEVLTAGDTNGYLMQGVLVFASAAARDAAITSPQEGQTCYLKDTDVIQVYSGSAWVTKSGGSPLTTKGDLYGYSTTDARIGVGANGTVLTADSTAATGVAWAVPSSTLSLAQIASGSTTSGTSLSLTSLTSYDTLKFRINNVTTTAVAALTMTINSSASAVYDYAAWFPSSNTGATYDGDFFQIRTKESSDTKLDLTASGYSKANSSTDNIFELDFYNCKATGFTTFEYQGFFVMDNGAGYRQFPIARGIFKTAAAVSSIQFKTSSAFTAGSYILWGG